MKKDNDKQVVFVEKVEGVSCPALQVHDARYSKSGQEPRRGEGLVRGLHQIGQGRDLVKPQPRMACIYCGAEEGQSENGDSK